MSQELQENQNNPPVVKVNELSFQESRIVNEYVLDFNVALSAQRAGVSPDYAREMLKRERVKSAIYAIIADRYKQNRAMEQEILENTRLLINSDIADYFDWKTEMAFDENGEATPRQTIALKPKDKIKDTRAIKSIKMGKYGIEITLHDKVAATSLAMQALGLVRKAQDEDRLESKMPSEIGAEVSDNNSLEAALVASERQREFLQNNAQGRISMFDTRTESFDVRDVKDTPIEDKIS